MSRRLSAFLILIALVPASSLAQGLSSITGGSSSGPAPVERGPIEETANRSFSRYIDYAIADAVESVGERLDQEKLSEETARVSTLFSATLTRRLDQLEGDGILGASEVDEELSDLRDRFEQQVETVVSAIKDGFPPPPLQKDRKPSPDYLKALAHYTLMVRNSPTSWLLFLGFLVGGVIIAWGINKAASRLGERVRGGGLPGIGSVLRSLAGPLYLASICLGLQLGFDNIWVPASIRGWLHGGIGTLLVAALFWFLWNASPGITTAILRLIGHSYSTEFDGHAHNILLRCLRILIIVAMTLVIVRLVLDTSLGNMLTGLGILGVALYFILRGTIENVAASFTLFSDQPFRVGDQVIYDDDWGVIEDIGFRSTQFRTFDGFLITIPNSQLIDVAIVNAEARPSIRRRFRIGLTYDTPPDKIQEAIDIVKGILQDYEGLPEDCPANVEFDRFGAYDLQLLVHYFYEPADYWQALAFDTKVNLQILEQFSAADIQIAYPTETHIVEGADDDRPVSVALTGNDPESASSEDQESEDGGQNGRDIDAESNDSSDGRDDS